MHIAGHRSVGTGSSSPVGVELGHSSCVDTVGHTLVCIVVDMPVGEEVEGLLEAKM